jgi:hypothetical protein
LIGCDDVDSLLAMTRGGSHWLNTLGIFAALAVAWQAVDLVYEQTGLTWANGPQNVGFTNSHILGPLILLPPVLACAYILSLVLDVLLHWIEHHSIPEVNWLLPVAIVVGFCVCFVPS